MVLYSSRGDGKRHLMLGLCDQWACLTTPRPQHANFFYKNIVWVFAMFWYQLFCKYVNEESP